MIADSQCESPVHLAGLEDCHFDNYLWSSNFQALENSKSNSDKADTPTIFVSILY